MKGWGEKQEEEEVGREEEEEAGQEAEAGQEDEVATKRQIRHLIVSC